MEKFILSSKEFLLLCAGIGVTEVYGIEDGYTDVDISDLSGEIRKVQCSLENKGYMESDFDGNSSVCTDLIDCIKVCAMCRNFIAFNRQLKFGETTNIIYYFYDEKVIRSEKKSSEYHLTISKKDDVYEEIISSINLSIIENPIHFNKVHIPQKELNKIKKTLSVDGKVAATHAINKYFDTNISEIILGGFEQKENFYSLVVADLMSEVNSIKSVMLINSDNVNIKLSPIVVDLVTEIEFEEIDAESALTLIDEYLQTLIFK